MTRADPAQGELFVSDEGTAIQPAPAAAPRSVGPTLRPDAGSVTESVMTGPSVSARSPNVHDSLDLPRHPRAEREIRLGEHRVAYAFRRARRRSIGFVVGPEGLSVSAPRWVGVREVEGALRERG